MKLQTSPSISQLQALLQYRCAGEKLTPNIPGQCSSPSLWANTHTHTHSYIDTCIPTQACTHLYTPSLPPPHTHHRDSFLGRVCRCLHSLGYMTLTCGEAHQSEDHTSLSILTHIPAPDLMLEKNSELQSLRCKSPSRVLVLSNTSLTPEDIHQCPGMLFSRQ